MSDILVKSFTAAILTGVDLLLLKFFMIVGWTFEWAAVAAIFLAIHIATYKKAAP
jgi:hypothetical protein